MEIELPQERLKYVMKFLISPLHN